MEDTGTMRFIKNGEVVALVPGVFDVPVKLEMVELERLEDVENPLFQVLVGLNLQDKGVAVVGKDGACIAVFRIVFIDGDKFTFHVYKGACEVEVEVVAQKTWLQFSKENLC